MYANPFITFRSLNTQTHCCVASPMTPTTHPPSTLALALATSQPNATLYVVTHTINTYHLMYL